MCKIQPMCYSVPMNKGENSSSEPRQPDEKREVVTVKIADLKPAKYNPRKISEHDYQRLRESMSRDGLLQTILINKDGTVIAGHQRLKAAEHMDRRAYVMELDPHYAEVIVIRYNQFIEDARKKMDPRTDAEINRDEA